MTSESVKLPIDQPKLIRSQFNTCLIWPLEVYFKSVNFIFALKEDIKDESQSISQKNLHSLQVCKAQGRFACYL